MSGIPHDFQDWRYRLRNLQELHADARHSGWVSKLHAKVLRYFISRYEYQPLPMSSAESRVSVNAPQPFICDKIQRRLREQNETSYRRGEECREILAEIHTTNVLRRHREN